MENKQKLFRDEVFEERQNQSMGTVLLVPKLSHRIYVAFGAVAALSILALLIFGHYARKARVDGWLVSEQGVVQIYAPQAGVVSQLLVKEGTTVREGDRLAVLSGEVQSKGLGATHRQIVERLTARRKSLLLQRAEVEKLRRQHQRSLRDRLNALAAEKSQLEQEAELRKRRVALTEKSEERLRQLKDAGAVSEQQLQAATEAKLDESTKLHDTERARATNERERLMVQGELDDAPLNAQTETEKIDRDIAQLEQELAEAELRRAAVITAPASGTVTAIQAEIGGRPGINVPLMSIVPSGSKLLAHLYCASRSVGFLKPGQAVLLRYQAYPFQKFGHQAGVLTNISRSAVNPAELPPQLAGLTTLVGTGEPVYRVEVALARQTITAYGKEERLQPGMKLEADVVIERRRLIEWMLEPLYTLSGRVRA